MHSVEQAQPRRKKQSDAAVNAIANLDPQLRRFAHSTLELMQLQVLQTMAAHKDPSQYPMQPRQVHGQNATKPNHNVERGGGQVVAGNAGGKTREIVGGLHPRHASHARSAEPRCSRRTLTSDRPRRSWSK